MQQSYASEANSRSVSQEIPSLLWNLNVHSNPLSVPIVSQMNPIYHLPPYFLKMHIYYILHLRLGLPSGLFPSGFTIKILYAFLVYTMHIACHAHRITLCRQTIISHDTDSQFKHATAWRVFLLDHNLPWCKQLPRKVVSEIWGSHGGEDVDVGLLGYDGVL
jgi:hypothetical protein